MLAYYTLAQSTHCKKLVAVTYSDWLGLPMESTRVLCSALPCVPQKRRHHILWWAVYTLGTHLAASHIPTHLPAPRQTVQNIRVTVLSRQEESSRTKEESTAVRPMGTVCFKSLRLDSYHHLRLATLYLHSYCLRLFFLLWNSENYP
jgi:hypothetical protein